MVHKVESYKDCVSGKIFDNKYDAIESELKSADIEHTFESFYGTMYFNDTNFVNGNYCIQRNELFYIHLLKTIVSMVHKHEPHIIEWYSNKGALFTIESVSGQTYVGRLLSEKRSQVSKWYSVQMCICPTCYREYGQPYYALNCEHNDNIPTLE